MNYLAKFLVENILGEAVSVNKVVVVYAGRFQPFHRGHFATYTHLVKKFGKDSVFIGTSNKTDNDKSPFNFKEKKEIMTTMFGIPSNKIVEVKNPYKPTEIIGKYSEETTAFVTVVGEKDELRLGGKYFQKWKNGGELEGYRDRGYVYVSPAQPNAISGTDVRNNLGKNVDDNTKMDFFTKRAYPKFDKKIYTLITKKLSESAKPITISKEVIEEWVITKFPTFMTEVSQGLGLSSGKDVDDGPNFFFPNYDVFNTISQRRAEHIGYTLFKQITDKKYEDYYEHPIYPNGPVKAVTPFPAGVIGKTTAINQKDITDSSAYDLWFKHVTRAMALAGYSLVRDKDEIEKRLAVRDLESYRQMIKSGDKIATPADKVDEGMGLSMGYPSKVDLEKKLKQLKDLRDRLDSTKRGDEYYEPYAMNGGITEDIVKLNNSLNISRDVLPQIDKDQLENYLEYLESKHIPFEIEFQPIASLNSAQSHIDTDKVKAIMKNEDSLDTPIIVSKDDYILDGHHRALAAFNLDKQSEIPVVKVDLALDKLIDISNEFNGSYNQSINEIPMADLVQIDKYADKQLNPIDVVLTDRHFFERLTDPRNDKPISAAELTGFFKRIAKNKKKFLEFLDQYGQVVAKDNRTNINIPFMKQANRVIAKTIMRKDDFKTSNPTYKFEDIHEGSDIDGLGSGNNSARWTASGQSKKLKFAQLSGYEQKDFPTADELDISGEGYGEVSVSTTAKYNNKKKAKRTADGQLVFENKIKHQFEVNAVSGGKVHKFITGKNLTLKGKKYGDVHFELVSIDNKTQIVKLRVLAPKDLFGHEINIDFRTLRRGPFLKTNTKVFEDITIPVSIGDTVLMGKFKNKKVVVKSIGKDEHGMPTINGKKVATFRMVKESIVDSGEPETGYIPDGKVRIVGSDVGRPEPWFDQGGYTQMHFPKSDAMRGKGKSKDIESSFRKVTYKTSNVKVSALKKAMKPVGSDEWNVVPMNEGLLLEGGAYGHMNHPFDNEINLTFGQLKDIVNRALDGELELAREKTDGQALAISWVNGKLVAARNKGHLANRGANALDIKGVATKFAGRGELEKAYNFAMNDLSKAIKGLSEAQRQKIFKDGACFMNLEVIYPTSVNVIPYGQALLVFHGTMEYNEKGEAIGENQQAARILAGMIKQINADVQSAYTIQGPPVTKLPKSQKLSSLKGKYNSKIAKLQSQFKLSDNAGISEYHQAWWTDFVQKKSPVAVDNTTLMGLVKRWAFYDKEFRLDAKSISDPNVLDWAKGIDKNDHAKIAKDNIRPFEDIFLGVGSEVLSFMSSVLTANPDAAVRAMKDRLDKTIKDVQTGGDPKKIAKLKLELERLNAIGGKEKIVPNEGIVFVYGGNTMKLTGTFAPLNQILGLFYE
jgi:hypothetical protein